MKKLLVATLIGGILGTSTLAAEETSLTPSQGMKVNLPMELIAATDGKVQIESVVKSVIKNPTMITLEDGTELHLSEDKKYFVIGNLFKLENGRIKNVTAASHAIRSKKKLDKIAPKDMVTFKEKGEYKGQIWAFTDVTCGYCQKLHKEVAELNANGIRVNYLTWPRGEKGSKPYNLAEQLMCSEDKVSAMNTLKANGTITSPKCIDHNIDSIKSLGTEMGLRGTPFIVFDNGETNGGYLPAREIIKAVEAINATGAMN